MLLNKYLRCIDINKISNFFKNQNDKSYDKNNSIVWKLEYLIFLKSKYLIILYDKNIYFF